MSTFKELDLMPEISETLEKLGFIYPTEIQKKAIPLLLSSKKIDFHGQAQTGTGKTLAFAIPLLHRVDTSNKTPQALIVAPTRELAIQIYESINQIAKSLNVKMALIYGGASMEEQIRTLRKGVQIVIGTPGRIRDHIKRKNLNLSEISTLVLDEADIMLDMGFKEEIDDILKHLPKDREIWLFSATVKPGVQAIKKAHMEEPVVVKVSSKQVANSKTEQFYCIVPFKSRLHAVTRFIQSVPDFYGFIFCQTKILTSEVADELTKRGYNVGALHGDMSQAHRNMVIKKFKQKNLTILVATDVAARGIDVANLTHVINYSMPEDLESYVHRIGRTGRAGKKGVAITFINKSEVRVINQLERKFGFKILPIDIPSKQMLIDNALKEISSYLASVPQEEHADHSAIYKLIDNLSETELRRVTANLLYNKFISTLDLAEIPYTHVATDDTDELQEIYINLGADDQITKEDVEDYLLDTKLITQDQIKKIRILNRRTYVKLEADCTPELVVELRKRSLKGKKPRINVTCYVDTPQRRGGPRSRSRSGSRSRSSSNRRDFSGSGGSGDRKYSSRKRTKR